MRERVENRELKERKEDQEEKKSGMREEGNG